MILSEKNTLLEDIEAARKEGYTSDFMYREGHLICRTNNKKYSKSDCTLVEYCRHEGMNDPSDSSILFLIECNDGTKGCLSSAYGVHAEIELIEFVRSLEKKA
jgi:hypothetical protein|tara:strand:+ start:176 stop:484 length:309 start_codon:yes stop_codon:yes gene_type:complete